MSDLDLSGQTFGWWTVIERAASDASGCSMWSTVCICGRLGTIRRSPLLRGRSTSCRPCATATTNATHRMSTTPLYGRWQGMHKRTGNPREQSYPRYGGRGITVCERWQSFENFAADMGPTFSPELEIDRIDNDGPYSPENCRWATRVEQTRNRSDNRVLSLDGRSQTVVEWAAEIGVKANTLSVRLYRGLPVERVLREVSR